MKRLHLLNSRQSHIDKRKALADSHSNMGGKYTKESVVVFTMKCGSFEEKIKKSFEKEGHNVNIVEIVDGDIRSYIAESIDIFVNCIYIDGVSVEQNGQYVEWCYSICQIEANYFIENNVEGHIVNVCRNQTNDTVVSDVIKTLTQGLGYALGNHYIITNGVVSNQTVPEDIITSWIVYLSGKYGDFLAGNVLLLTDIVCEEYIPYMS